jgi:hypothetical protein
MTPTIILVRVSMGLSFDDDTSIVEAVESVVRCQVAPDEPILNSETGSISSIEFAPESSSGHEKYQPKEQR